MNAAALVLGICGVVLASLSLGWQAVQHVLTGGRVKVRLQMGALGDGGMVTVPPAASARAGGKSSPRRATDDRSSR